MRNHALRISRTLRVMMSVGALSVAFFGAGCSAPETPVAPIGYFGS